MGARAELEHVIAAHAAKAGASQQLPASWVMNDMDFDSARRAAVLILFGSATAAPLDAASTAADLDLLFVTRADTLRKHAGQVAFPGGGIDAEDRSTAAAALREAWEETGVDTSGIEVLGQLAETQLPISNFLVTPVIGWWHRESKVWAVDQNESAQVFRAPVAHLLDPANRFSGVVKRGAQKFKSPAFAVEDQIIWGFTAIVLDKLFGELGWNTPWDTRRERLMN